MADKFLDQDETLIYGPYASRKIRNRVAALIPEFTPAMTYLADRIDDATGAVQAAIETARGRDAEIRAGTYTKTPVLKQARSLLGSFSKHLSSHERGQVDRKVFFTADGTATGVGKGAQQVLLAITHINARLQNPSAQVRERAVWQQRFAEMMTALAPVLEHADDARTDRREITPEVEAARQAWLSTYVAARAGVECVLRLRGKVDLLPTIFYDLAVPAGTKVTTIPDSADPAESEEESVEE